MIDYLNSGKLGKIARADVWANFNYGALGKPIPDSPVPEGIDYEMWQGPAKLRPFNQQHFHVWLPVKEQESLQQLPLKSVNCQERLIERSCIRLYWNRRFGLDEKAWWLFVLYK